MADRIGPAFHVSRVGTSSQFGGDTFTIKAHFHSREQAELAKRLLETETLGLQPRDAELVELAEKHAIRSLTNGQESRWWFNFPGLRALIEAARASSIVGVGGTDGR
jgi:hypothetical protein